MIVRPGGGQGPWSGQNRQVKASLDRMHRTEDIDAVVVEAYEVVEDPP